MRRLHEAIKQNNVELVFDLLSNGEDPNAYDGDGKSALDICTSTEIEDLLFTFGATRDLEYYLNNRFVAYFDGITKFDEDLKLDVIARIERKYSREFINVSKEDILEDIDEVYYLLFLLGVNSIENRKPLFEDRFDNIADLIDLLYDLDLDVSFEGSENGMEGKIGIYYIE